jgi:uncharacterized damage-inducible protein DinB
MYRRIDDFTTAWGRETDATLKLLRACTDASLAQRVAPAGRTLGRIAWHVAQTLPEMLGHSGLPVRGPAEDAPIPKAAAIAEAYASAAAAVGEAVRGAWTDAMLGERVPMYGEQWMRGEVLASLVAHQAHHRGQMTVLMRQAGLPVPGIYGPAAEEWASMGMVAQP